MLGFGAGGMSAQKSLPAPAGFAGSEAFWRCFFFLLPTIAAVTVCLRLLLVDFLVTAHTRDGVSPSCHSFRNDRLAR